MEGSNNNIPSKGGPMIYLLPGASATGRDFLLEQLLNHKEVVGNKLGLERPIDIHVIKKTTTRPSRPETVEVLKICVSQDEFSRGLKNGAIIAPYTLESNGHHYGYHRSSFNPETNGSDVMISDASVYQIPHIKNEFGKKVYAAAMIATRKYREDNFLSRGSEKKEEIIDRLNLGDAHVVIAVLMHGKPGVSYADFVPAHFASMVDTLVSKAKANQDTTQAEKDIEQYSKSKTVATMIKNLAKDPSRYVDELVVLTNDHRISSGAAITETEFFNLGVNMLKNVVRGNS